jgi:acetyl esterase/lipase
MRTFLFCLLFAVSAQAQQKVIQIWPGVTPGSEDWKQKEVAYLNDEKQQMIRNVVTPTLTAFLPDPAKATGTAVIVAPGGGFRFLSWQTEGTEVAEWLAAQGVAAFVLKYRVINTGTEEEYKKQMEELRKATKNFTDFSKTSTSTGDLSKPAALGQADGRQAVKVVRENASAWGIKPDRIGIMGFSAGGMVTLGVALRHDAANRPNFAGAIYAPWSGGTVPADAPPMFVLGPAMIL